MRSSLSIAKPKDVVTAIYAQNRAARQCELCTNSENYYLLTRRLLTHMERNLADGQPNCYELFGTHSDAANGAKEVSAIKVHKTSTNQCPSEIQNMHDHARLLSRLNSLDGAKAYRVSADSTRTEFACECADSACTQFA